MDKDQIRTDYEKYSTYFKAFQAEIFSFTDRLAFSGEYGNIDIVEVKQRPGSDIKSLDSIYKNIDRPDKYLDCKSILDLKDIAGVRVICNCEDDWRAFAEILENKLNESQYLDVKSEDKTGGAGVTANQKTRPSYRAIHINCAKKIVIDKNERLIYCEIQLRTVMGDAWAVQDRKYVYGQTISEGDRNILTESVNGIMTACEGLWALVKKKYKDGQDIEEESFAAIAEVVKTETAKLKQNDGDNFNTDLTNDKL